MTWLKMQTLWVALATGLVATAWNGPAQASEIAVAKVRASSTLAPAEGVSYAPENAVDSQVGTFWVEGEESAGLGEWIQFDFAKTEEIDRIEVRPGNWYSNDFWTRHNRMKEVQLKFQMGAPVRHEFKDKQEVQVIKLEKPVKTRFVRIILKGVFPGTTFNDTCLAEVRFFGPGDTTGTLLPSAAAASTTYDGYPATDVYDGMRDTLWCEKTEGDGVGEWLELTLPAETSVKGIRVMGGTGAAEAAFMRNNRISQLKLSAGSTAVSAAIPDKFAAYHEILFPAPVTTRSLRLTVEKVTRGLEFNDTCIAEVQVIPASP